jgi:hypothetical protein
LVSYNPGKVLGNGGPFWRCVYTAVLGAIDFVSGAEAVRNVDVNEIAEEKHEMRVEFWDPFR